MHPYIIYGFANIVLLLWKKNGKMIYVRKINRAEREPWAGGSFQGIERLKRGIKIFIFLWFLFCF